MQFLLALIASLSWLKWVGAGVLIFIGIFWGLFYFWRKIKEEHYELWETFDAVFFSAVVGIVIARLGYLLLHITSFPFSPFSVINLLAFPGLWSWVGLIAAYAVMFRFARQQKRDHWELWDFYTLMVTWFLAWWWLSRLVLGAAAGTPTNLPWGILFPQRIEPAHPVQIYAAVLYFLLFRYLWWAEPKYRFFIWYRSKKRTANPGFLTAVFLIVTGLMGVVFGFIQYPLFMVFDFELNQVVSAIMFMTGLVILYIRSGQEFFKKDKRQYATSFPVADR